MKLVTFGVKNTRNPSAVRFLFWRFFEKGIVFFESEINGFSIDLYGGGHR